MSQMIGRFRRTSATVAGGAGIALFVFVIPLVLGIVLFLPFLAGLEAMGVSGGGMYLGVFLGVVILMLRLPFVFEGVAAWGMWAAWGWPWYGVLAVFFAPFLLSLTVGLAVTLVNRLIDPNTYA